MTCPHCGRYGNPDPETGYDADEPCPDCKCEEAECASNEDRDDRFGDAASDGAEEDPSDGDAWSGGVADNPWHQL